MTTVFVHGNPEVDATWTPVLDLLHVGDVVRLSPPGFGSPIPVGFGSSVQEYRAWLVDAVTAIGAPVDIVGHDIGGSTTIIAVMERPDLFRSWVSDSVGVLGPGYVWHGMATAWQTPRVGERAIEEWTAGSHDARLALAHGVGASGGVAEELAAGRNPTLARAVLGFSRSAAQPVMADLGRTLDRAGQVPGLAVIAADDHFVGTTEMWGTSGEPRRSGSRPHRRLGPPIDAGPARSDRRRTRTVLGHTRPLSDPLPTPPSTGSRPRTGSSIRRSAGTAVPAPTRPRCRS